MTLTCPKCQQPYTWKEHGPQYCPRCYPEMRNTVVINVPIEHDNGTVSFMALTVESEGK